MEKNVTEKKRAARGRRRSEVEMVEWWGEVPN